MYSLQEEDTFRGLPDNSQIFKKNIKPLKNMEIEEAQKRVLEFEKKWAELKDIEFTPELTTLHLIEEVGEMTKQLFYKKAKPNKFDEENLKEEVIDVILVSLCLADKLKINLSEEIDKKINELNKRDYSKV